MAAKTESYYWQCWHLLRDIVDSVICGFQWIRRLTLGTTALMYPSNSCEDMNADRSMHIHPFNGPFSGTTRIMEWTAHVAGVHLRWAGTRKAKPIWILLKQETVSGSGNSWAICQSAPCSRQITTPAPHHSVFYSQMPFLPPNQQHQSTEGKI